MKQAAGDMGFPTTIGSAVKRGFSYQGPGKCKACGAALDWWKTPSGKKMPTDSSDVEFKSHFATCPHADQFRRKPGHAQDADQKESQTSS
jgi:hypothetical protein